MRRLRKERPETRLVLLGSRLGSFACREMLSAGASACVDTATEARDIVNAVHLAARGLHLLRPFGTEGAQPSALPRVLPDPITPREAEVLEHLKAGRTNAQIALALSIGVETVRSHARSITASSASPRATRSSRRRESSESPSWPGSIARSTRAGAPAATTSGGRSRVTTELAPTTQRSPTVTPLVTTQLTPNQQLDPIVTGPLGREPLPRHRDVGVVVAVLAVAHEAPVGEHGVGPDRDALERRHHRPQVEEAPLADDDAGAGAQREPAVRLEVDVGADLQPPVVERVQHVAVDGEADERLAPQHVAVDARAVPGQCVVLVPAPAPPPQQRPLRLPGARHPYPPPAGVRTHTTSPGESSRVTLGGSPPPQAVLARTARLPSVGAQRAVPAAVGEQRERGRLEHPDGADRGVAPRCLPSPPEPGTSS